MLVAVADCRIVRVTIPCGEAPATGCHYAPETEEDIDNPWNA